MKRERPRSGWPIGRVAGVELRMHPTFLVMVAFALLGLFGRPLDGLVWLGLVFGGVVLHELGHALVARRLGLQVRDIVLLPIGGASEIDGLDESPGHELVVAAAGPATSFALAGAIAVVLVVAGVPFGSPTLAVGGLLQRGLWTNLMLGTFNLLPALPMDGGRMLRALMARRMGIEGATLRAAAIGRRLAIAMGIVGVLYMPWLLVIAVFVHLACRAEEQTTLVHQRLAGLVVADVMVPIADPSAHVGSIVVHEHDRLEETIDDLAATPDGIATVLDESDHAVGILLASRVAELVRPRH